MRQVLLVNVGTCAVTRNSTCLITFKNKKRDAIDITISEFTYADRQFATSEDVYVSVLLQLYRTCSRPRWRRHECRQVAEGLRPGSTPGYIG